MKYSKYQQHLGDTTACTKKIMEASRGIGQRYRNGSKKDFLFLIVCYTQISIKKLQWKMVTT